jgi:adenylate kinase family enzyme
MKVYLIGGPPKCGKTTLAKIMSKRFSIPWISADTLQNIASVYIPEEEHTKYFPHSIARS